MGQHRTKEQKQQAQLRREQQLQYSLDDVEETPKTVTYTSRTIKTKTSPNALLSYSQKYIIKDLRNAALASLTILVLLLGIWYGQSIGFNINM